jgi:16S rRNA (guanine(966)-N(2))-methyltransferase RsmD
MRVIAGELKGRRLVTPRGSSTRPTSDLVRGSCLDTLMPWLGRGPFLDLFAGAGAVGVEALSRGAPAAVFVETDARAVRALRENLAALGLESRATVIRADAVRAVERLATAGRRFDVVFIDPPYDSPQGPAALEVVADGRCLEADAIVVVQHATKSPPPERAGVLEHWKARRFGGTTLTFLRSPA